MGLIGLIVFIIIVAIALNLLEIGGKPAQLIWLCVAAVVVLWLLGLFGIWSPPRGFLHY